MERGGHGFSCVLDFVCVSVDSCLAVVVAAAAVAAVRNGEWLCLVVVSSSTNCEKKDAAETREIWADGTSFRCRKIRSPHS